MRKLHYTIVLTRDPEEGGFVASVPALPGCHTSGETEKEAYTNALDAIQAYLESLVAHGEPIPVEAGKKTVAFS
jgi:predicted RNase H-like HicB family nuclease